MNALKGGAWRHGWSWKVWAHAPGVVFEAGVGNLWLSVWRFQVSFTRYGGHGARSMLLSFAYRRAAASREGGPA